MLQHLALFHGEALPVHALSLLQNAFECNYEPSARACVGRWHECSLCHAR